MEIVLFLDDDVVAGDGVLASGRNRMEDHYEYFIGQDMDALLFDGRIVDQDGQIIELDNPVDCAQEIVSRLRVDYGAHWVARLRAHIVLDIEWFGNMEFGKELLEALYRSIPSGQIGRVVVCSKWASKSMREEFVKRFEILKPQTLDKALTSPQKLWDIMFPSGPDFVPA
jgi:hypothetical protein